MTTEPDPADVWDRLRRADDLAKYAGNRPDPSVSIANARALLDEAASMLGGMSPGQREFFLAQIEIRRADLDKQASERR